MQNKELKDALQAFNQSGAVTVAIPTTGKPHELRAIQVVGHIDHPGEVKTDHTIHPLDIVTDSWEQPSSSSPVLTVADLAKMLAPFPDPMLVRVAVPVTHDSISHRMLDITMLGHTVGSAGSGIQLICEHWESPWQVVKELPEVVEKRNAT